MDIDNLLKKVIVASHPECPAELKRDAIKGVVENLSGIDHYVVIPAYLLFDLGRLAAAIDKYDLACRQKDERNRKLIKIGYKDEMLRSFNRLKLGGFEEIIACINLGSFKYLSGLRAFLEVVTLPHEVADRDRSDLQDVTTQKALDETTARRR